MRTSCFISVSLITVVTQAVIMSVLAELQLVNCVHINFQVSISTRRLFSESTYMSDLTPTRKPTWVPHTGKDLFSVIKPKVNGYDAILLVHSILILMRWW